MKPFLFLLFFIIALQNTFAQCTTGNCKDGNGTYNYGWCVYSGEFKNGKPEGKGVMKYDDYTYNGEFKNGLEDGTGEIVNKDGSKENVVYSAGVKTVSGLVKVDEKDYKPLGLDKNCLSGNCINGYGTYQFPSGNKYTGNFIGYRFEGQGAFYFSNGDKFDGIFHNNEKSSGTYYYSIGATYKGTYDDKGNEYNGTVTSVTGISIPFVNGKAIIPPAVTNTDAGQEPQNTQPGKRERIKTTCYACNGTGKTSRTEDRSNYGAAQGGGREYSISARVYSTCSMCGGSGVH